ncbi:MAG: energy transducer TonB [Acidobacteriaceae bacterium]
MNRFANVLFIAATLVPASAVGQVCVKQINVPEYPPLAWSAQWKGVVHLTLTIGAQGQVVSVDARGPFPYLVEQSKKNVKEWLFCAPKTDGSTHVQLRYDYRLEGARVYRPQTAKVVLDLGDATVLIKLPPPEPQP